MRILFFGNNFVGYRTLEWLLDQGEDVVGIVLHPPERMKHGDQLLQLSSRLKSDSVMRADELDDPHVISHIRDLRPDIGISSFFGYLLRPPLLSALPKGCVNIHPSYLPYNRGAHPNIWTIVDGTPAGVSLHWIDSGVDTGPVIARRRVRVLPVDTGETLYRRLESECIDLFKTTWPSLKAGQAYGEEQGLNDGSFHRMRDLAEIDHIELDDEYGARKLINILRARTFGSHPGAFFIDRGRKIYLRLELTYEEDYGLTDED